MKTKIFLIIAAVILLSPSKAPAYPNWDIYSDTDIYDGNYSMINIYDTPPNSTTVNMYGGSADYITTFDQSTLNFYDGSAQVGACDYSIVNITGGTLNGAEAYNYGTVYFSGDAYTDHLFAYDFGTANMSGGIVDGVGAMGSGIIDVYFGEITDSLSAYDSAILNLYAYDFHYDPTGGKYDDGKITGRWIYDDGYFDIDLYGSDTFSHINVIPEPCSLILLTLGGLILRRKA